MSMHNGMCGHIGPGSVDFKEDNTLSDYINRKSKHDALANAKPKLTFSDWWKTIGCDFYFKHESAWQTAEAAWKASQEYSIYRVAKNTHDKMSFNEWFTERYKNQKWLHEDLKNSMYRALQDCWNASKENS